MKSAFDLAVSPWLIRAELLPALAQHLRGATPEAEAKQLLGMADDADAEGTPQSARAPAVTGGVAIIPLRGMITPRGSLLSLLFGGGGGLRAFRRSLREAVATDEVSSIVIDIDSPGGLVDLVPETAAEIRAAREKKPITAIANTLAASAAYWLAAQASEVVVTPSGEAGSIGVYILHEEISKLDERLGFTTTLISAGRYKVDGNPWKPLTDSARDHFQQRVDETYALFTEEVASGRGVSAAAVRAGFGEGRVVRAQDAVSLGMADRVETIEQTVTRLVRGSAGTSRADSEPVDEQKPAGGYSDLKGAIEETAAALRD